ncbi:MAG: TonB-dependent receptor [Halioglobus sp.]
MDHTKYKAVLALSVASALGLSQQANAQLEEVVVTAQKKQETLIEAPVAVSVVSGQEIADLSIFQADELNKLVSGMDIRYEGDSNVGVGLRGVGTFAQQSAPARVGTYLDDFYMASQAAVALGSMFDMANVQVLKGPQGTLYGQPSPTGALIMASQDPNFDGVNGYVQGSYMDPAGYNVQGAINLPVTDTLAVRIAGLVDDRETGTEVKRDASVNFITKTLDEERNRWGTRVKVLWEPSETFQAKLGYLYMESDESETYRILETEDASNPNLVNYPNLKPGDRIAIADNADETSKEDTMVTLHLNWMVGDIEVKWFSGMLESIQDVISDQDNTDLPSAILTQSTEFGKSGKTNQHELRVNGTAFDFWDWTVGGYYADADSQTNVVVDQHIYAVDANPGLGSVGVFPFTLDIPIPSRVKALFTHNDFALTEDTTLTVGVRYNEFSQRAGNSQSGNFLFGSQILPGGEITDPDFIIENAFPCFDGQSPPCELGESYAVEEWTGTIKLSHYFSDAFNVYGTVDRAYRPGAANFDTTGVFTPDLNAYDGEEVDSIEIGTKGDIFDGSARYTAAVYFSVYTDYQARANFEAYNTITEENEVITNSPWVNVDEAEQWGIEADLRWYPTDDWMLYGGFSYAQVEFTDGEIPCTDPGQAPVGPDNRYNTCAADGLNASEQPELTGVLQTEYTFSQLIGDSDAYVGVLYAYRGEVEEVPGDAAGRLDVDSYGTLDLFTGLRSETWSVQVFAKNLTDEDGVLSRRPVGMEYNELTMTPPRTIGITGSYNF